MKLWNSMCWDVGMSYLKANWLRESSLSSKKLSWFNRKPNEPSKLWFSISHKRQICLLDSDMLQKCWYIIHMIAYLTWITHSSSSRGYISKSYVSILLTESRSAHITSTESMISLLCTLQTLYRRSLMMVYIYPIDRLN